MPLGASLVKWGKKFLQWAGPMVWPHVRDKAVPYVRDKGVPYVRDKGVPYVRDKVKNRFKAPKKG